MASKIKKVVRGGKIVRRKVKVSGAKSSKRVAAGKKAAIKGKAKRAQAVRKRTKSLKKRDVSGLGKKVTKKVAKK